MRLGIYELCGPSGPRGSCQIINFFFPASEALGVVLFLLIFSIIIIINNF